MTTKPRNPYLLPALAAGLVIGAGASTVMLVAFDKADNATALDPIVAERIEAVRTERAWAAAVCGAVETWRGEIGDSVDAVIEGFDITEPGVSWDIATTAFGDARDATSRMVEDIHAAEVPDTPSGRALADGVDQLIDHAAAHVEEIGVRVAAIGGDVGVSDGFNFPGLIDEARALYADAQTDIEALREPAGDMLDALRATDSCAPFLDALQLS